MILEAVVTNPNYLNATHCTLKMTIGFNSSSLTAQQVWYSVCSLDEYRLYPAHSMVTVGRV